MSRLGDAIESLPDVSALSRRLIEGRDELCAPIDSVLIEGDDATAFLQGQLTQDLSVLGPGQSAWSLLLEPDGKLGFLLRVLALGDGGFLLLGGSGQSEAITERLNRFRLRVKVAIATAPRWLLAGSPETDIPSGAIAVVPSLPGPVSEWILDQDPHRESDSAPGSLSAIALVEGVVTSPDADEGMNPFELGRAVIERSVSFTKGCYTGQELVARIDARGVAAPFRLCAFSGSASIERYGPILVDGEEIGSLYRVVRDVGGDVVIGLARVARRVDLTEPIGCMVDGESGKIHELA